MVILWSFTWLDFIRRPNSLTFVVSQRHVNIWFFFVQFSGSVINVQLLGNLIRASICIPERKTIWQCSRVAQTRDRDNLLNHTDVVRYFRWALGSDGSSRLLQSVIKLCNKVLAREVVLNQTPANKWIQPDSLTALWFRHSKENGDLTCGVISQRGHKFGHGGHKLPTQQQSNRSFHGNKVLSKSKWSLSHVR